MFANILKAKSFFDLCVSELCFSEANAEQTLEVLYSFGYRTIAINYLVEDGNFEVKKKKKKGGPNDSTDLVPVPSVTDRVKEIVSKLKMENFEVLSRLTISFSNQEVLHKITKSPNYKKFHIVAALPTTMQAFMFTCNTFEADIFTIDPENKFSLRLSRKLYNQLVDRGYHIELLYSPAIEDSTKRKHLIHASHLYHAFGKSKNIVFSSGAQNALYIRNPYDIINLGCIFGLNKLQCKNAVTHCPRKTVINSVGRKFGKSVMFVKNVEKLNDSSVIIVEENSDNEDMELDQPIQKKSKV